MLQRLFFVVKLICFCGVVGGVLAGWQGHVTPRVFAATNADCQLTVEQFKPPSLGGQPYVLTDLAGSRTGDVWAAGWFRAGYHSNSDFVAHWDGAAWETIGGLTSSMGWLDARVSGTSSTDVWETVYGAIEKSSLGHWDGSEWQREALPPDLGVGSVSARASDDVWLRAGDGSSVFFMHWDGTSWSQISDPANSKPHVYAILGTAPNRAWAVGTRGSGQRGLLLFWNGTQWRVHRSPLTKNTQWLAQAALDEHDVWVVGYQTIKDVQRAVTMHWDGKKWKAFRMPRAIHSLAPTALASVAALASDNVWAVGSAADGNLVLHWNGKRWKRQSVPASLGATYKIVAAGPDRLWMQTEFGLMQGDGMHWTMPPQPQPGYVSGALERVKVLPSNDVWLFGTAVERKNGSAFVVVPPAMVGEQQATYVDVDGQGGNDFWMLGQYRVDDKDKFLVAHSDGTNWARLPDPYAGEQSQNLSTLAVLAPDDTWVLGLVTGETAWERLAIHWDGQIWSQVAMPQLAEPGDPRIAKVYARAADDVWALGTTLLHWDGTAWSEALAAPFSGMSFLESGEIWAVSFDTAFRYDGKVWQNFGLPLQGWEFAKGIVAFGPADVYVLPRTYGIQNSSTVILHGNGVDWERMDSLGQFFVDDVSQDNLGEFWVVGTRNEIYQNGMAYIYHFTRTCE